MKPIYIAHTSNDWPKRKWLCKVYRHLMQSIHISLINISESYGLFILFLSFYFISFIFVFIKYHFECDFSCTLLCIIFIYQTSWYAFIIIHFVVWCVRYGVYVAIGAVVDDVKAALYSTFFFCTCYSVRTLMDMTQSVDSDNNNNTIEWIKKKWAKWTWNNVVWTLLI